MFSPVSLDSKLSDVFREFLDYARVIRKFAPQSLAKYQDCFRQMDKVWGNLSVAQLDESAVFRLQSYLTDKHLSCSRQRSILYALKSLICYLKVKRNLTLPIGSETIVIPRRNYRDVIYLTPQDIVRLLATLRLKTHRGQPFFANVRLRALIEILLGTAMRIGEALSLDRNTIDFAQREARIIGKGNKERTVFFTKRSLSWLKYYWEIRSDDHPAAFVSLDGSKRLQRGDIWRQFARARKLAGIAKPVRPHILRHTAATQMLLNGCPIMHIKEILGHRRLETTCRHYLGLDRQAAKSAHEKFLVI